MPSPLSAASNALLASKVQPEGVTNVSGSDGEGLFQRLASVASGFMNRAASTTVEALKPGNLFVPGGSAAAQSAAKVAENASSVAAAAGEGIKAGFNKATFIIVLILAFVIYRTLK